MADDRLVKKQREPDFKCDILENNYCTEFEEAMNSDSDVEFLNFNAIDAFQEELECMPEVRTYITNLQICIRRQQLKIKLLMCDMREYEQKLSRCSSVCDASTQTDDCTDRLCEAPWQSIEEESTVAEEVRKVAECAMQQTGFAYEETSGMYYDYNTGYYYNAELGLYYDGSAGTYYYYDENTKDFLFHSKIERTAAEETIVQVANKRKEKNNSIEERKKIKNAEESPEEGECSESSDSEREEENESVSDAKPAVAWPPCMRIILKETNISELKIGSLFIVTCTGGTLGREGDHAVSIPDVNISKHHAKFIFKEPEGKYFITDFGSRNGTYLNGIRLSVSKQESELHEVVHGSILKVGSTKLLCHIHIGSETCGHCEPGLIQQLPAFEEKLLYSSKKQHRKELHRIRQKFGLSKYESKLASVSVPGYEDRAQIRRETVGSQHHHEKTQTASEHEPIPSDNKGFKLMSKMGWSQGEPLGKDGKGRTEPVTVKNKSGKEGLGAEPSTPLPPLHLKASRKKEILRKTQERYQNLS